MNNINEKAWKEFRGAGLLWLVNMNLHLFGWALVVEMDGGNITNAYPAKTHFRGFSEQDNTEGYTKVTKYLKENTDSLIQDVEEK